jgi:ATP-binding cassette subfamily B protein
MKAKGTLKSFHKVIRHLERQRVALALTIVSMLVLVGIQLIAPQLIRTMVATVTDPEAGAGAVGIVARLALLTLGVYAARAFLQFVRSYAAHVAAWHVVGDVRDEVYRHLQRLSLRFYEDKQTGQLMSRTVNDSELLEQLVAHAIPDVLVNVLMLAGVTAVLVRMSWQLALLSMVPIPFIVLGMRGFARYVRPAFQRRQVELGELNAALNDNLSGIREIQAFTREDTESERIWDRIVRHRDSLLHALKLMAVFHPSVEFAASLGTIVLIYFGGRLVLAGSLPIADLVAYFLYLELLYAPVRALSTVWENIQQSLAGADRIAELLDQEPDVAERADALDLPDRAQGAVRFEDVSFRYAVGDMVLKSISLDVPAGSVVALVGPTGVGKSTLSMLIPRFYDVTEGRITLDGHDVRTLSLESLRSQISIVLQEVFLFHGTVRENILFGRPDASEDEMVEAARIANASEFIDQLPEGYDTMIGERGVKLSGGQRQRLAIARAVLRDAPILILDEATSSVDTETEYLIQQALERLMEGRTTVVIAHRLSTIRRADSIVVLQDGMIVDQGTHDDLIARDGLYRHLSRVQLEDDALAAEIG